MTLTEFIISAGVSGGLVIVLPLYFIVRIIINEDVTLRDMLALFIFMAALLYGTGLIFFADDPGLYTRTLGPPQEAKVEGLTYIGGSLWQKSHVRVDTDKGSFLFDSDALIPHTGEVYLVRRQRPWGDPRLFLCLTPMEIKCWAESQPRN